MCIFGTDVIPPPKGPAHYDDVDANGRFHGIADNIEINTTIPTIIINTMFDVKVMTLLSYNEQPSIKIMKRICVGLGRQGSKKNIYIFYVEFIIFQNLLPLVSTSSRVQKE